MTVQEAGQVNYPEIVLGKAFRPFSAGNVDDYLKIRKIDLDALMKEHVKLDNFPITIYIQNFKGLSEYEIPYYGSPFGNVTITQIIGPDGRTKKAEGFVASIVDSHALERPPQSYAVTVEINGKKLEGTKARNRSYLFSFGQWGSRGFLIPEELDLSELEYTFTRRDENP